MEVDQIYCGDHFAIYTNIKSLCCKPETNVIRQLDLNLKKRKEDIMNFLPINQTLIHLVKKFFEKHNLPKQTLEKIHNLDSHISLKKLNVIKNLC